MASNALRVSNIVRKVATNAKRAASRLSGFGEAVIDEDTRNGRAVHVVRVRVVDAAGPQAVIDAAGRLGLPGAFVVRTAH